MTDANTDMCLSEIYPDKHKALSIVGQLKPGWQIKGSPHINKHDTLFIRKYANLGHRHRPINQVIKCLRNSYRLKWLQPRVIYSRHTNSHEKFLGNLKQKLLWKVIDANLGHWSCSCLTRFKINGECTYGGDASFQTAGTVYTILCKAKTTCNCFYIGKSQCYIKTRVQEHIDDVTKLYSKYILFFNQPQMTPNKPSTPQTKSLSCSSILSLKTQASSTNLPPQTCVIINSNNPPSEPSMPHLHSWANSNTSLVGNNSNATPLPTILLQAPLADIILPIEAESPPSIPKQENCSTLACHLVSCVKNLWFNTRVEVAEWCCSHIKVDIIWQSNPITPQNIASTKSCRLCAAEQMVIGQNLLHLWQCKKIINLKSQLRGECTCKTRFLWFPSSDKEGGSDEGVTKPKNRADGLFNTGYCIFLSGAIDSYGCGHIYP